MSKLRIAITSLLLFLVAVFVIQNWDPVTIRFLFWTLELPRLVLATLLLLTGFVLGVLAPTGSKQHRTSEMSPSLDADKVRITQTRQHVILVYSPCGI